MLTCLYNFYFYKFLKSGLLVDFYFKRMFHYFLFRTFLIFSIFWGEKYIIEYIFLRLNTIIVAISIFFYFYRKYFTIFMISLFWMLPLLLFVLNV